MPPIFRYRGIKNHYLIAAETNLTVFRFKAGDNADGLWLQMKTTFTFDIIKSMEKSRRIWMGETWNFQRGGNRSFVPRKTRQSYDLLSQSDSLLLCILYMRYNNLKYASVTFLPFRNDLDCFSYDVNLFL
jgi:hypothetical protein